jgi:hypothetical protein
MKVMVHPALAPSIRPRNAAHARSMAIRSR